MPLLEMFLFERPSLLIYSNTEDSTFFRMTSKDKRDSDISFLNKQKMRNPDSFGRY